MGNEYQSLTVHSKKNRRSNYQSKGKTSHSRKYPNTIRCYTCDEKGHISKFHPNKINIRKKNKRRHHSHAAEDDEPSTKRFRQESDNSSSEDEYVLISTLTGTVSHGSNDWIIDSGSSKHMTGFKE